MTVGQAGLLGHQVEEKRLICKEGVGLRFNFLPSVRYSVSDPHWFDFNADMDPDPALYHNMDP